jgi:alpha-ribazole phosphatase
MRLYLVRHPRPQLAPEVCYGRSDVAVDPQERARVVDLLRAQLPSHLPLFSSPLQRCAGLAADLCGALDLGPVTLDPRIAEIDFGSWEMRTWQQIGRAEIDAWAADTVGYRPGGGESVLQMAARIAQFYDALLAANTSAAIVICHAGAIRLLRERARGLSVEAMARAAASTPHQIGYGELLVLP